MDRPENVGDALTNESGDVTGEYHGFRLRSAYQPIYGMRSNAVAELLGFEGLIRPYKDGECVAAEEFFSQTLPEDRLFVEAMCMALHIRNYPNILPANKKLFLNVNVSSFDCVSTVESEMFFTFSQLAKYGLSKDNVVFEIHRTAVAAPFVLTRICDLFRSNGYCFALDDFGVEHSNIERYLMLRPDIIKIDRNLFGKKHKHKMVKDLLHSLIAGFRENGVSVLMEGLETEDELMSAIELEASMMQGFALSKPQHPPGDFPEEITIDRMFELPSFAVVG